MFGDKLLFVSGSQLWTSDGTETGTELLEDTGQWITSNLLPVGDELYFGTQNGLVENRRHSCRHPVDPHGLESPQELTAAGGLGVLHRVRRASGPRALADRRHLATGRVRVKDIFPAATGRIPGH